ncbi:MAG: FAD-dependent oxidoreductase [Acidimicrobiales bacterium]|nr:FAD-dependent oxidoreductase [Acidimicrobiales bacterium]
MSARVVIIGGGLSGVATAVNLADTAASPLAITLVDPAEEVGKGVAYGTQDPDHRLNGPSPVHFLTLDDHEHFTRWHSESGACSDDPGSVVGSAVYPRRRDFGRYVASRFAEAARSNRSRSELVHVRDRAVSVNVEAERAVVRLADGTDLVADVVVVATSNGPPAVLAELKSVAHAHAFIADPWADGALAGLPESGRVLIVGTGLTMADVAVTLQRDRHGLALSAISRRGLLPRSRPTKARGIDVIDALTTNPPAFVQRHPDTQSVRQILRLVREEIRASAAAGREWQGAFDDLRDAAHVVWPKLSPVEQARFVRLLATWYEVHRFRFPPPTERIISAAIDSGALTVDAARIVEAEMYGDQIDVRLRRRATSEVVLERFDAVINCTGPERKPTSDGNPFLNRLVEDGVLVPHPLGLGVKIDALARAVDRTGNPQDRLRIVGPLARGRFGECMGVLHIVARLTDALPSMLATTGSSQHHAG